MDFYRFCKNGNPAEKSVCESGINKSKFHKKSPDSICEIRRGVGAGA